MIARASLRTYAAIGVPWPRSHEAHWGRMRSVSDFLFVTKSLHVWNVKLGCIVSVKTAHTNTMRIAERKEFQNGVLV